MNYFPRDVLFHIQKYLASQEVLLLVGARQMGKTTLLKQLRQLLEAQGESCFYVTLEDPDYLSLLDETPKNLSKIFPLAAGKRHTIFIDEIQYLKDPSRFLKYHYDINGDFIKSIVSGSSAFYIDRTFKDSLAGRKRIFEINPLSFKEFLIFKNESSLADRFAMATALSDVETIEQHYNEYMLFGGYPRVVLASTIEEKIEHLQELAYSYIKKDIHEARIQDDLIFYKLFKILAAQIGQLVNAQELANTLGVSKTRIDHYLFVMQKSFHVHLVRPFSTNIRKELTKMPKIYFSDSGLRNFFVNHFEPYALRQDKGALLENMVFRALLRCYSTEEIHFWRTTDQNEVDFIVNQNVAIEVKANPKEFKLKKYEAFQKNYPAIPLEIVTFSAEETHLNTIPLRSVWRLS